MPTTAASMRTSYPALFTSTTTFPDTYLTERIANAELMIDDSVWPDDDWFDLAVLYKAAELALRGIRSFTAGTAGGPGNIQSMSTLVGSVSYDLRTTTPTALADAFLGLYRDLCRRVTTPFLSMV